MIPYELLLFDGNRNRHSDEIAEDSAVMQAAMGKTPPRNKSRFEWFRSVGRRDP